MPVYFVRAGTDGPIKIGFTAGEISKRLRALQSASAMPLLLLGSHEGERLAEQLAHQHFAAARLSGEWFEPTGEILAVAKSESPPEWWWTPRPQSVTLEALAEADLRFRRAREASEEKREARNATVRQALAEGWKVEDIAAITGLTPGRISQLRADGDARRRATT